MFSYYFFLTEYIVNCRLSGGRLCSVSPGIPINTDITLTDILIPPTPVTNDGTLELALSTDLAMFFAYLLKFFVFHFVGLLLCWVCTMSFRRSLSR